MFTIIKDFILTHDFVPAESYTLGVLIVLCTFLLLCLFRSSWRRWVFRRLKWVAGSVFVVGILVYMIGFNDEGSKDNILVLFMRACISSLEMFVSESELIEVSDELKKSHVYMTLFAIVHFLAVFVSAIFILRLFGLRLMSMLRLWLYGLFDKRFNLYVFWGINDKSLIVAESMMKDRILIDERKKSLLVFVKMDSERHHHSSRFTFSHFFHTTDDGIENFVERIDVLNSGRVKTFITVAGRPINMILAATFDKRNIFESLGLKNLSRCMRKSELTEFFFMSDDEENNIESISTLQTQMERYYCGGGPKYRIRAIYCHGRENRLNKSILRNYTIPKQIYLIDSSMLAVQQLKTNPENQPISFVDYDSVTGTVLSVFTAMIIGFGETGRDVLRFLYEFSSFVKETKTGRDGKDHVIEQDKKIYVVDSFLKELKTKFLVNAPALKSGNFIEWLDNMSTHDMQFWDKLKEIINQLNYVVITVDNDEEAEFIAVQLFEFAHRYRENLERFRIYVRLRNSSNRRMIEQIEKFRVTENGKDISIIQVFGTQENVFSYSNISSMSKEEEVRRFENGYQKIYNKISRGLPQEKNDEEPDMVDKDFKSIYQLEQNRSNAWHIYTKMVLAGVEGKLGDESKLAHLLSVTSRDDNNEYSYLESEVDKTLFNNLAYCEHLRWNAKMELLGFVYGKKKSMRRKTHYCLLTCDDLIRSEIPYIANTLKYDKGIVELSLRLGTKSERGMSGNGPTDENLSGNSQEREQGI